MRECDYGELTRRPAASLDPRERWIDTPFPGGESLSQVVARVGEWLREARASHAGATILVIGHRATFYAFEHLLRGVPLRDAVTAPWTWQPGWTYEGPALRPTRTDVESANGRS